MDIYVRVCICVCLLKVRSTSVSSRLPSLATLIFNKPKRVIPLQFGKPPVLCNNVK